LPGAKPFTVLVDPIHHYTAEARPFLSEVDVLTASGTGVVVAFGDSITDGFQFTPGADDRWPDVLARRIHGAGLELAVDNEGISGNQVLADGAGPSALSRFDRDVLAIPGVRVIILLEGINDIGYRVSHRRMCSPRSASFGDTGS
jgi:lysophospholipase L1-like esterase